MATDWATRGKSEHLVQFYEQDVFLVQSVAAFMATGLQQGETAIIIVTDAHREAICQTVRHDALDLRAAQVKGQLLFLDAAATLAKFMVNGFPEQKLFKQVIGKLVAKATARGRHLRAFGEMVALLWEEGNPEAAILLEEFWNNLARKHIFTLLCGYPMRGFCAEPHDKSFNRICNAHSRVIPAERHIASQPPDPKAGIILLQQRSAALQEDAGHRLEVEKVLARRERELSEFLENATEGIHAVAPDGKILWANKAEFQVLGYSAEEYIGHEIREFHADPDVIEDILRRLAQGETLRDREARLKHKDGSIRHVSINSSMYREGDKLLYTRCFTRDITERKRAAEGLALLAAIVESSDDAIVTKNLDGVVTSWNKGAERIFGYTALETVGQHISLLIPPDRPEEEPAILARLRTGERIEHFETVRRRKDGALLDISLTVSPVRDAAGKIVGASKIARDITELRKTREDLARSHQVLERSIAERTASLEQALVQMEDFTYSVSHDLRAPARAIAGIARVAVEDYGEIMPAQLREFMDRIIASGQRMDQLIRDLLDYSRVSRAAAKPVRIELDRLVSAIVGQRADMQPPRANIRLRSPLLPVLGHEASLSQAVTNLLANAVKFVAPGAHPEVELWTELRGGFVRLWVKDNGIGINPLYHNRLFKLFERAHNCSQYEGTGVGLAIVRIAVEKMGGAVGVLSDGCSGCSFWLELPAAAQ